MQVQEELIKRIEFLEEEVSSLKLRISGLEKVDAEASAPREVSGSPPKKAPPNKEKTYLGLWLKNTVLTKDGLESIIGGKFLNRIGILILLFGVAYFLKYSFDNHWINEVGRIIIGLIGGALFLVAGDIAMNKKYTYFSQGLTGGGIAIIYLTTFAAANFYSIFSPPVAFGLLALTALAGVTLSIRHNALAVAFLSTIGGFLSPFLIGSKSGQTIPLLSYVVILDLVILALAYYKNWRSLNLLAFIGTVFVYTIFQGQSTGPKDVLIIELFLLAFFIIFGTLAFFYNVRHKKPTMAPDVLLMVLNIAFFLAASLDNLSRFGKWHGLLVIVLAVVYLMISLSIQKRKTGDNLLFLSLLGIGLALVTLAIPLQLEGKWIDIAWLVQAVALVYAGIRAENKWVSRAGLSLLTFASLTQSTQYVSRTVLPIFNLNSIAAFLAIAGFFLVFYWFYTRPGAQDRERVLWPAALLGTWFALKQVSQEMAAAVYHYRLDLQDSFAVSLAWAALAVIFMIIGMTREIKGFRFISLALFGLTVAKIMLFDLNSLAMVLRVIILLVVGAILVGVSFAYQRKDKGVEKDA